MRTGLNSPALSIVGIFFFILSNIPARADLITSGFHGIRIYDERSGGFIEQIGTGEEQEGIAFARNGGLYFLVNDLGGGWIGQYGPRTYRWEGSFGPHDITGMPWGMTMGRDGNLYIGGTAAFGMPGGIRRIDGRTGADLGVFVPQEEAGWAYDLVFGPDGNLYVSSWEGSKIRRFNGRSGEFIDDFVPANSGGLDGSAGIAFGPDGNLYVSSGATDSVLRYDGRTGAFLGEFVPAGLGGLDDPAGLAFGPDDHLYVCSRGNHAVMRYDGKTGAFIDVFVTPGSGGLDNGPNFIAFTPRPPRIAISRTAEGMLVRWAEGGLNCSLESASALSGGWGPLTNSPAGSCAYLIGHDAGAPGQQRFFRLKQAE
jgi:streptogramin lyase